MSINRFAVELLKKSDERFSVDSLTMSMSEWVSKNTTILGKPFSFKGYDFQRKILDDMHPNLDCIKISQVGLTEVMIRKILAFLRRHDGLSAIYSLPTQEMFERISSGRIKPIINTDKVFAAQDGNSRSMGMMQFGRSFLYVVAAIETAATSISADAVFNDEVDLSNQQTLGLFGSRLQNSTWKISQRFSTPSFPAFGIDLNWQASDQHNYMRRCTCCGNWNIPEFNREYINIPGLPDNIENLADLRVEHQDVIDLSASFVMCAKCRTRLDLSDIGEWVSKYPSRTESRGYRVTPFCTNKLPVNYIVRELWKYQKLEFTRGWWNTVLGLPYSDGTIQIPKEDIIACMTDNPAPLESSKAEGIWVGIDVGQVCHIIIGRGSAESPEIINMYTVHIDQLVEHVRDLCATSNVYGGCIDRHPYEPTAQDVFNVSGGKIVAVEYRGQKDINMVYDVEKNLSHVQVNHTSFLDRVSTIIKKRKLRISGYSQYKTVFIEHLRDMVRDEVPGEPAQWRKLTKNDHFFHATGFMLAAPHILEMFRLTSKLETRTMVLGKVVDIKDGGAGLIGVSKSDNKAIANKHSWL